MIVAIDFEFMAIRRLAVEAVKELKSSGHLIMIYCCRENIQLDENMYERVMKESEMITFLNSRSILYDAIRYENIRPEADRYIDIKSVGFDNGS